MNEFVNRSKLLEKFNLECSTAEQRYVALIEARSEEVKPIIHSYWSEIKDDRNGIFNYQFKCNHCGGLTPNGFIVAPDYCPYCGTLMDGEENKG